MEATEHCRILHGIARPQAYRSTSFLICKSHNKAAIWFPSGGLGTGTCGASRPPNVETLTQQLLFENLRTNIRKNCGGSVGRSRTSGESTLFLAIGTAIKHPCGERRFGFANRGNYSIFWATKVQASSVFFMKISPQEPYQPRQTKCQAYKESKGSTRQSLNNSS
jgi:hypothetical protein